MKKVIDQGYQSVIIDTAVGEVPRLVFRSNINFDPKNCIIRPSDEQKGWVLVGGKKEVPVYYDGKKKKWFRDSGHMPKRESHIHHIGVDMFPEQFSSFRRAT